MSDTRRAMTRAEFDEELRTPDPRWWQTGAAFIHHPAMQRVEGYYLYGAPGNLRLTEAQRVLMIWADLVGEVANGGVEQFAYNSQKTLPLAEGLLPRLEWPDLMQRLTPALAEQKALFREQQFAEHWVTRTEELGMVARQRSQMIDQLAKANTRLNPFKRAAERARLAELGNDDLTEAFDAAVDAGKLTRPPARGGSSMDLSEEPDTPASRAFDDWLYQDETKAASATIVGDFIRRRRDELVRFAE